MAESNPFNQFGNRQPSRSPDPDHCAQCETMLADALDRTLSAEDQALFDRHLAICPECSRIFIETKQGADLLEKLHDSRPEPSANLLERILASTGPASATHQNTLFNRTMLAPVGASLPESYPTARVLPFRSRLANAFRPQALRHTFMQPRLAMTAAMAFFSIALTLNLTGIHLTQLRPGDFTPSSLKRSFYDTNARVIRSIDNLRVVYELESRVRDLQQRDESGADLSTPANTSPAPAQSTPSNDQNQSHPEEEQNQQKRSNPHPRSGSSRSLGLGHSQQFTASLAQPGSSPRPGHEPQQVFVIFTPTVFNAIEQGGQA